MRLSKGQGGSVTQGPLDIADLEAQGGQAVCFLSEDSLPDSRAQNTEVPYTAP